MKKNIKVNVKQEKIVQLFKLLYFKSSELLTLTYGAIVGQIVKDNDNIYDINDQLEKMGFNIGQRLIDEFLAKSEQKYCSSFKEISESMAKQGFEMFLGVKADIDNFELSSDKSSCQFILKLTDNPLNDFVELPENLSQLHYSNIICGVIRGALSMMQLQSKCTFLKDQLKNDDITEIKVEVKKEVQQKE